MTKAAELERLDQRILAALASWRTSAPTYVVTNILNSGFPSTIVTTPQVRRRLVKLEAAGKVKKVPSSYAVMLVWQVVEEVSS